jgi:hypothetical protein
MPRLPGLLVRYCPTHVSGIAGTFRGATAMYNGDVDASVSASQMEELVRQYLIPEKDTVMSYLSTHREIVGLLLDARPPLEKFFGHDVQIELRLADGIESDRTGELLAVVQSHLDADAALKLIGRFWDDWWKENSARREAWPLYIDVEYAGEPASIQ